MKLKMNLRDLLVRQLDLSQVTVTLHDVDEFLQASGIAAEQEVDLEELFQRNRIAGGLVTIEDVRKRCPKLTDVQAEEVLRECQDRLVGETSITWDLIEEVANDLYSKLALRLVRFTDILQDYPSFELPTNLVELLADALHWCRTYDTDFTQALAAATTHLHDETPASGRRV